MQNTASTVWQDPAGVTLADRAWQVLARESANLPFGERLRRRPPWDSSSDDGQDGALLSNRGSAAPTIAAPTESLPRKAGRDLGINAQNGSAPDPITAHEFRKAKPGDS